MSQKETLDNRNYRAYTLFWVQYSYGIKPKLESFNVYAKIHKYLNIFELMKHTKTII